MANAFFSDLLATISERGRTLLRRGDSADTRRDADGLIDLCDALLSGRGEASGIAIAREVLDIYRELDAAGRRAFFDGQVRDFGPDRERLSKAIEKWRAAPSDEDASSLHFASEPREPSRRTIGSSRNTKGDSDELDAQPTRRRDRG